MIESAVPRVREENVAYTNMKIVLLNIVVTYLTDKKLYSIERVTNTARKKNRQSMDFKTGLFAGTFVQSSAVVRS